MHQQAVKCLLRYLKGTVNHGLTFLPSSSLGVTGYCDSNWASRANDRRSIRAYCVFLGSNLISCKLQNKKLFQGPVLNKSIGILQQLLSFSGFVHYFFELHLSIPSPPHLLFDNKSAINLSHNPIQHACTKYIELDQHFVHNLVLQLQLTIGYVSFDKKLVDILAKPLATSQFHSLKIKLLVLPCPSVMNVITMSYYSCRTLLTSLI